MKLSLKTISVFIVLFAILLAFATVSITLKYKERDDFQCSIEMGDDCPHKDYYPLEFFLGILFSGLLVLLGLILYFYKQQSSEPLPTISPEELKGDERTIYSILLENEGAVFQNELVKLTGLSRVKVTRILDKLEGKGFVIRRRRGMTNMIILKNQH